MSLQYEQLRERLWQLERLRANIAEELEAAGRRLLDSGVVPSGEVIERAADYRRGLSELATELNGHLPESGDGSSVTPDQLILAVDLAEKRQGADALLDELTRVSHVDDESFEPINELRGRIDAFRSDLHTADPEHRLSLLSGLEDDKHPLRALHALVYHEGELDDDLWSELHECVGNEFGQPMATAIARSRLAVDGAQQKTDPAPKAGTATAVAESRPVEPNRQIAADLPRAKDIPALARSAISATGVERRQIISKLILELLADDRPSPAFHLARSLEQQDCRDVDFVPSALIRAVALAQRVHQPGGELALQIRKDLASLSRVLETESSDNWKRTLTFLLVAASARPAVAVPETQASRTLHGLDFEPQLSGLRNYCVRIAVFGDEVDETNPALFQKARSPEAWEQELEKLTADVDAWMHELPLHSVRFESATHCFLKNHWTVRAPRTVATLASDDWRQTLDSVDIQAALLQPIVADDTSVIDRVRSIVDSLSAIAFGDGELAGDCSNPVKLLPSERRTLGFARRWISLRDAAPEPDSAAVPRRAEDLRAEQQADELRAEITARHESVLEEILVLGHQFPADSVAAAIRCCWRSLNSVRDIFTSDQNSSPNDPEMKHIMHGELLAVPSLRLDEQWEPVADALVVEDVVLDLLSHGTPNWRQAFDSRCEQRDHEATGRLLELDVWDSGADADKLRSRRHELIETCTAALQADIDDTSARLEEARAAGALGETDSERFATQLVAVKSSADRSLDFSVQFHRLGEIRDQIERRRRHDLDRLRARFEQLGLPRDHDSFASIESALADGRPGDAAAEIAALEQESENQEVDWVR